MFAVSVMFRIKPGAVEHFMPLIEENAAKSLGLEEGCRHFDICTDAARPEEVFLYELDDDADAFARHKTTTHYARFDASVSDMVEEKAVRTYDHVR